MIVSFTGTREGMTHRQDVTASRLLAEWTPTEVHHGDCIGSDKTFADICADLVPRPMIVAHPGCPMTGSEEGMRANSPHTNQTLPVRTYLRRNRDMVMLLKKGDVLLATPQSMQRRRGGTWYTIQYGWSREVRVVVVRPDGTVMEQFE